jgi:hypothetical protein
MHPSRSSSIRLTCAGVSHRCANDGGRVGMQTALLHDGPVAQRTLNPLLLKLTAYKFIDLGWMKDVSGLGRPESITDQSDNEADVPTLRHFHCDKQILNYSRGDFSSRLQFGSRKNDTLHRNIMYDNTLNDLDISCGRSPSFTRSGLSLTWAVRWKITPIDAGSRFPNHGPNRGKNFNFPHNILVEKRTRFQFWREPDDLDLDPLPPKASVGPISAIVYL